MSYRFTPSMWMLPCLDRSHLKGAKAYFVYKKCNLEVPVEFIAPLVGRGEDAYTAFIYAKGLTFPKRNVQEKTEKDLAYMFEILRKEPWRKQAVQEIPEIAAKHPPNWFKTFCKNLDQAFQSVGSAGPAGVARQVPNRPAQDTRRESFELFRSFLKEISA